MGDTNPTLVGRTFCGVLDLLAGDGTRQEGWSAARRARDLLRDPNAELTAAVDSEDLEALRAIVAGWYAEDHKLPEQDRNILKRALKAYRKRLKLTLLDAESSIGGGPMSGGRASDIVGITPPDHYPRAVWDELVRLGRLIDAGRGMYELPPGG